MKRGKSLTRNQKENVAAYNLNPSEWVFMGDVIGDDGKPTAYYKIMNQRTGKQMIIDRFRRNNR